MGSVLVETSWDVVVVDCCPEVVVTEVTVF
jgi:hypothetical protein